jgi:hypothetical protein
MISMLETMVVLSILNFSRIALLLEICNHRSAYNLIGIQLILSTINGNI